MRLPRGTWRTMVGLAMLPLLALAVLAVLVAGYFGYGRVVARNYALDDARVTPACRIDDGVDFVPTKRFYCHKAPRGTSAEIWS